MILTFAAKYYLDVLPNHSDMDGCYKADYGRPILPQALRVQYGVDKVACRWVS